MTKIKTVCIPHKIRIPLREGARGVYGQQQLLFTYLKFKNFGPDLPLVFKLHEICSVDFRKIVKIVANRCQILSLKCTKIILASDPTGGAYSAHTHKQALPHGLCGDNLLTS